MVFLHPGVMLIVTSIEIIDLKSYDLLPLDYLLVRCSLHKLFIRIGEAALVYQILVQDFLGLV